MARPHHYLLLVLTVAALAVGQVLFKLAAGAMQPGRAWHEWIFNRHLVAALFVYAAATGMWIALLREVPLSAAYPFAALAFFFVPVLAHFTVGEPLRWQTLAGAAIIFVGVWVSGLE
ncbi:EamA family transporter [Ramlibacter albus]|uniref:EamA family transporter n=1 Tax=Ramlibacter albus TaxID=2079448 RepID=A0A923M7F0_9BURK|nr:EamA family transporter [Ramlibacter albus]MBC5764755.1 EamA family transporter [Ramlibacter albus]